MCFSQLGPWLWLECAWEISQRQAARPLLSSCSTLFPLSSCFYVLSPSSFHHLLWKPAVLHLPLPSPYPTCLSSSPCSFKAVLPLYCAHSRFGRLFSVDPWAQMRSEHPLIGFCGFPCFSTALPSLSVLVQPLGMGHVGWFLLSSTGDVCVLVALHFCVPQGRLPLSWAVT